MNQIPTVCPAGLGKNRDRPPLKESPNPAETGDDLGPEAARKLCFTLGCDHVSEVFHGDRAKVAYDSCPPVPPERLRKRLPHQTGGKWLAVKERVKR